MPDFALVDTSVISRLSKSDPSNQSYLELLQGRLIAISFQTDAELKSAGFGPARQGRLSELLEKVILIGHQDETSACYAEISAARRELKKAGSPGGDAADGDVWIVATALEHQLPLLSHDRHQIALARAAGVSALTAISDLREDNPKAT